jgi:hypothetical protein
MKRNYDWVYELFDSNMKYLGTIGSSKHLSQGDMFIVNGNSYQVIKSYYNKQTDYNSDLTVIKTGSVNLTEQLYSKETGLKL